MKKYFIASTVAFFALVALAAAQEYSFTSNLSVGAAGPDVTALQSWLISNGYDIPAVSILLQRAFGILWEILYPPIEMEPLFSG